MARPLRIQYPGAMYHLMCRGNWRQDVFMDGPVGRTDRISQGRGEYFWVSCLRRFPLSALRSMDGRTYVRTDRFGTPGGDISASLSSPVRFSFQLLCFRTYVRTDRRIAFGHRRGNISRFLCLRLAVRFQLSAFSFALYGRTDVRTDGWFSAP